MTSLNTSANSPSILKSYQSIVTAPAPSSAAPAGASTYGQWAVFSVTAPLVNAFQGDASGKESVLKVQSTGEGDLIDLVDEFSDGRIQFSFVKVRDPNTGLPKFVLICWCGEGVPERTKGYFASHTQVVAKLLHGYHVQLTARSDQDLTPERIVQKLADASGAKYSVGNVPSVSASKPPPVAAKKPAFTPTQSSGASTGFNPLDSRRTAPASSRSVDEDGWGQDAPPITRTQLEKVASAYQPTKVNIRELAAQKQEPLRFNAPNTMGKPDVVRGAYQPVGKVDIAEIRKRAQSGSSDVDDRPTTVKGAYEPVGKVDIAAIRARAQHPSGSSAAPAGPRAAGVDSSQVDVEEPRSLTDRSATFSNKGRLSEMPMPKVANRFAAGTNSFTSSKAPLPGGFRLDSQMAPASASVGVSKTFANEGGKSPAQLWAENKAKAGSGTVAPATASISSIPSGGVAAGWKSGYSGKSWAPVPTTKTGTSAHSADQEDDQTRDQQEDDSHRGTSILREKFQNASITPSAPAPPSPAASNKPNAQAREGAAAVLLPPPRTQPRTPTPELEEEQEDESSPVRIAQPISRGPEPETEDAQTEQVSPPPPMSVTSLAAQIPIDELEEEAAVDQNPRRSAGKVTAAEDIGGHAVARTSHGAETHGKRALVQYDYEKAEDNELELREGEYVTNIEMVDDDWWMGENPRGETGLFPSNYVELTREETVGRIATIPVVHEPVAEGGPLVGPVGGGSGSATVTAQYDYEAAEDNELSFPEGAKISNVEFPDEDWWHGEYDGATGLFPANYVHLDE